MKILFTDGHDYQDYLRDSLFHGLKMLFGSSVVDYPRLTWMYAEEYAPGKRSLGWHQREQNHTAGFTFVGIVKNDDIDRTDIENKIKHEYFDLVVMRPDQHKGPLYETVITYTPPNKIAWLDGLDDPVIYEQHIGQGIYFKRELISTRTDVKPISFAFPEEKIQSPCQKTQVLSPLIPGDYSTYRYNFEGDYYHQYNQSLFAITHKKNGWDCNRHYEIIGCNCVPWFKDIALCPSRICTTLPKEDLLKANQIIDTHGLEAFTRGHLTNQYEELRHSIYTHFLQNCTTIALARYFIDNMRIS